MILLRKLVQEFECKRAFCYVNPSVSWATGLRQTLAVRANVVSTLLLSSAAVKVGMSSHENLPDGPMMAWSSPDDTAPDAWRSRVFAPCLPLVGTVRLTCCHCRRLCLLTGACWFDGCITCCAGEDCLTSTARVAVGEAGSLPASCCSLLMGQVTLASLTRALHTATKHSTCTATAVPIANAIPCIL